MERSLAAENTCEKKTLCQYYEQIIPYGRLYSQKNGTMGKGKQTKNLCKNETQLIHGTTENTDKSHAQCIN